MLLNALRANVRNVLDDAQTFHRARENQQITKRHWSHLQRRFARLTCVGVAHAGRYWPTAGRPATTADGRTLQRWQALAEVGATNLSIGPKS